MQKLNIIVIFMLLLSLISCTIAYIPTTEPVHSTPTIYSEQSSSRPWITATPVFFDEDTQTLTEIFKQYYRLDKCDFTTTEQYSTQMPKLEFVEVNISFNPEKYDVRQIADSLDKSYRAYLVEEEASCPGQTYSCFRSRIYIAEQALGKVYKLDWANFVATRPIVMMIWVGNSTLTFLQSLGPHGGLLFGVGMEKQGFVYYSPVGACP